jgi:hypothetical protein
MCLVLDPGFTIMAQNEEHARATLSTAKDVVGKNLFAVFPDNPNHHAADGVSTVRSSLLKVLKTRQPDAMPVIRYDVKGERGPFQERCGRSPTRRSSAMTAMCAGSSAAPRM